MKDIQIFNTLCKGGKTVQVVFSDVKYAEGKQKSYTYRIDENMDVACGDLAVVERDGKFSFVNILEVHNESQIDVTAQYRYKWIVSVIKTDDYFKRLDIENATIDEIAKNRKVIERNKKKDEAKAYVSEITADKISRL